MEGMGRGNGCVTLMGQETGKGKRKEEKEGNRSERNGGESEGIG